MTALSCAYAGLGVWTLVAAPGALWFSRAAGYVIAAKLWQIRPRFRFEGAGVMLRYGTAMVAVQACWFVQSQSDIFIGGRLLDAHLLGIYTTALFLTQILAAKFVPPLNEVAFAAYSRIQARPDMIQSAFLKSIRLIMLVAMPFYFGLAVTAEPLVTTFLGAKWSETVGLVPILCAAMPLMTLQILFAPATNALGRPGLGGEDRPGRRAADARRFRHRHQLGAAGARLGLARRHGRLARGHRRDVAAGDRDQPARPVPRGRARPRRRRRDGGGRRRRSTGCCRDIGTGKRLALAGRRRARRPMPAS